MEKFNAEISVKENIPLGSEGPDDEQGFEDYDEACKKLVRLRVKFLRLALRLGKTRFYIVVFQVLFRLCMAEQLDGRPAGTFTSDLAMALAEKHEAARKEPLDFTCTILLLGKSGVGKSATINSIFDEGFSATNAFELGTKKVQAIVGSVQGIRVCVVDTPGLLPSGSDQRENKRILHSVKKFIKKTPPDVVLYLDRLDSLSGDLDDMPLLRTITDMFGLSIWFSAIVVLTHAASAPPQGPNGTAMSYDVFVEQRWHVVQEGIRQASGVMQLTNPVSLVENHSSCRTNRAGQRVLPNDIVWKPHLLLLSFGSKILAEAHTLPKLLDNKSRSRSESRSRFRSRSRSVARINKAVAGLSATTVYGDVGLKLEDKLIIGKSGQIAVSSGGIYGQGEVAYGASLEATLRDKDHFFLSTFGLSIMDWHGDFAVVCSSQTQIRIGRRANLIGRFNINNRGVGQVSIKIKGTGTLLTMLAFIIGKCLCMPYVLYG